MLARPLNICFSSRELLRKDTQTCFAYGCDARPLGSVRVCGGRGEAWRPPTRDTGPGQASGAPSGSLRATTTLVRNTCSPPAPLPPSLSLFLLACWTVVGVLPHLLAEHTLLWRCVRHSAHTPTYETPFTDLLPKLQKTIATTSASGRRAEAPHHPFIGSLRPATPPPPDPETWLTSGFVGCRGGRCPRLP